MSISQGANSYTYQAIYGFNTVAISSPGAAATDYDYACTFTMTDMGDGTFYFNLSRCQTSGEAKDFNASNYAIVFPGASYNRSYPGQQASIVGPGGVSTYFSGSTLPFEKTCDILTITDNGQYKPGKVDFK